MTINMAMRIKWTNDLSALTKVSNMGINFCPKISKTSMYRHRQIYLSHGRICYLGDADRFAEGRGGNARVLLEIAAEIMLIIKIQLGGDLLHAFYRQMDQLFGL